MPSGIEVLNVTRRTRLGTAFNHWWQMNSQISPDIGIGVSDLEQLFSGVVCGFGRLKSFDKLRCRWMSLGYDVASAETTPASKYRDCHNRFC
jgi:hypothetical protein